MATNDYGVILTILCVATWTCMWRFDEAEFETRGKHLKKIQSEWIPANHIPELVQLWTEPRTKFLAPTSVPTPQDSDKDKVGSRVGQILSK